MARKKQEIALQQEIETQEEWEELLSKEGLIVADAYQGWAGYSKAMTPTFNSLQIELNFDKRLYIAAGGNLVNVIRGANAPVMFKTVMEELKKEKRVLEGDSERVDFRDPVFAHLDEKEKSALDDSEAEKDDEDGEEVLKEVTVAILKPDVVQSGKADEVLQKMTDSGIEVLKKEERQLTEEEAKNFYHHLSEEPYFNQLIEFMCSGTSYILLLSKGTGDGKGIIDEWRDLIGPKMVEEAKEKNPDSWRAVYGSSEMQNALHGSDSREAAARELAFFFPEYHVPKVPRPGKVAERKLASGVQRTLALIRPDVLVEHRDTIIQKIKDAGFEIALEKEITLNREQAEEFYKEHASQPYFEELVTTMSSGPLLALGLAREDGIATWRSMLGPTDPSVAKEEQPESLRAQFVTQKSVNMLHGSDTPEAANTELAFFFPNEWSVPPHSDGDEKTVAVIKPDAYDNKDAIMEKIKEAGFHIAARKETELTRDVAEMLYADQKGNDWFEDAVSHMTSGKTLFMVLSQKDAVNNWRGIIGPRDPTEAKEKQPESIRAQFGTDIKANAVHGPSDPESAEKLLNHFFSDQLASTEDGKYDADAEDNSDYEEGDEDADNEDEEEEEEPDIGQAPEDGGDEGDGEEEEDDDDEEEVEYEEEEGGKRINIKIKSKQNDDEDTD